MVLNTLYLRVEMFILKLIIYSDSTHEINQTRGNSSHLVARETSRDCSKSDVFLPKVDVEIAFGDVRRVTEVTLVFVAGVQSQVHGEVVPAWEPPAAHATLEARGLPGATGAGRHPRRRPNNRPHTGSGFFWKFTPNVRICMSGVCLQKPIMWRHGVTWYLVCRHFSWLALQETKCGHMMSSETTGTQG